MNILNIDWEPGFGNVFTWFAMDKNGKIAVMINNGFGKLPICLLSIKNTDELLDRMNEYMWEESKVFRKYPVNKNGKALLDMYSLYVYHYVLSRDEVEQHINDDLIKSGNYSDSNLAANKGFYIYQAIEGSYEGEDYPVGYDGEAKMGDYFRYLMPTVYGSIEDFPEELRYGIAVSDMIDFTTNRLLDNNQLNVYFPRMYKLSS